MARTTRGLRTGITCRCQCGCTIWVGKSRNSSICRYCEGYLVFGKFIEPKHNGAPDPDPDSRGGNRPERDDKVKCGTCRIPIQFDEYGKKVIHDPKYYQWAGEHQITILE